MTDLAVSDEKTIPADLAKPDVRVHAAWERASAMHAQSLYLETLAYEIGVSYGGVRGIERGTEKEECARRKEQFAAMAESRAAAKEAREWARFAQEMDKAKQASGADPRDIEENDVVRQFREQQAKIVKEPE